jgi:hypothetical protein
MRSLWRGASLALALSLSMFAAGCGDDDDDITTPDTPAPQQPAPTPAPVTPAPAPTTAPEPQPPSPVPGDRVVFLGRLKTIELPILRVGDRTVQVQEQTQFVRGEQGVNMSDLEVGQLLRVRGRLMDDRNTILADKIAIEKE